jgi:hypothetical protein
VGGVPEGLGRLGPAGLRLIAHESRTPPSGHEEAPLTEWRLTRVFVLVGLGGIEPPTSALSVLRSNRLSYSPATGWEIVHDPAGRAGRPGCGYLASSTTSKRMPPTRSLMRLYMSAARMLASVPETARTPPPIDV